jgi:hypothetical protein
MDSIQEKALKMALSFIACTSQKIFSFHFKSSCSFNALSGKNPSGCWLVQPTNQMSDISAYAH